MKGWPRLELAAVGTRGAAVTCLLPAGTIEAEGVPVPSRPPPGCQEDVVPSLTVTVTPARVFVPLVPVSQRIWKAPQPGSRGGKAVKPREGNIMTFPSDPVSGPVGRVGPEEEKAGEEGGEEPAEKREQKGGGTTAFQHAWRGLHETEKIALSLEDCGPGVKSLSAVPGPARPLRAG